MEIKLFRDRPCVCLVEYTWNGHHPMFFCHFLLALLRLGYRVHAICPNPSYVAEWVKSFLCDYEYQFLSYSTLQAPAIRFRPRRWQHIVNQLALLWKIRKLIRLCESRCSTKVEHVFFACLYEDIIPQMRFGMAGFSWNWSGLYLQCNIQYQLSFGGKGSNASPIIRALSHPRLKAVGFLDPNAISYFSTSRLTCRLVRFPDFTDTYVNEKSSLAFFVRNRAAGRSIVLITGHLQPRKGIMTLVKASAHPLCKDWFFVFAGAVDWEFFSDAERSSLESLSYQENAFTCYERISSEDMNQLVKQSSLIYAAYIDFPHSSNLLVKASFFSVPIVVSEGYLMSKLVTDFNLGFVIPQKDTESLVLLLFNLRTGSVVYSDDSSLRNDFLKLNSSVCLPNAISKCIVI